MRLIKGMKQEDADAIVTERARRGPYRSIDDLRRRTGLQPGAMRALARADAFASLELDRQRALWAIQSQGAAEGPLLDPLDADEPEAALPAIAPAAIVGQDYAATGLSLKAHPMSFVREALSRRGVVACERLADEGGFPQGKGVKVAGMVLVRQRPGTASGVVFVTLEDEGGIANLIIRPRVFERYAAAIKHSAYILATGRVERAGRVVHVQVSRVESLDAMLGDGASRSRDFH
jgi:error-prone DNA polymerase